MSLALFVTEVAQQAVRLRPVETSVRPTRGYVDPNILEQHLMINKVYVLVDIEHSSYFFLYREKKSRLQINVVILLAYFMYFILGCLLVYFGVQGPKTMTLL